MQAPSAKPKAVSSSAVATFKPNPKSKPGALTASKIAASAFVDLSADTASLTIIKDAIRASGRFLSESPATIVASKGTSAQRVIYLDDVPLPLVHADICVKAEEAFKGATDFELDFSKYTIYRFTPNVIDFKDSTRGHGKPHTILDILPVNYVKTDAGTVVLVLVCNECEEAHAISQGGSGNSKDQMKTKAVNFLVRTVQGKYSRGETHPAFAGVTFARSVTVPDKHEAAEIIIKQVALTMPISEVNC